MAVFGASQCCNGAEQLPACSTALHGFRRAPDVVAGGAHLIIVFIRESLKACLYSEIAGFLATTNDLIGIDGIAPFSTTTGC